MSLTWWLLTPAMVIAAAATGHAVTRSQRWQVRRLVQSYTYSLSDGPLPPTLADRTLRAAMLGTGAFPAAAAAWAATRNPVVSAAALLCGGTLITAMSWQWDTAAQRLTRIVRRGARLTYLIWTVTAVWLAAGPPGELLVRAWHATGASVAAAAAILLITPAVTVATTWLQRRAAAGRQHPGLGLGLLITGFLHSVLLGRGLFLFCTAGLFHPDPRLLWVALGVTVLDAARQQWEILITGWSNMRRGDISILGSTAPAQRHLFQRFWLHDALVAHPRRPDLTLPGLLAAETVRAAHGSAGPGPLIPGTAATPHTGQAALHYVEIAEQMLDLAETQALDEHRPRAADRLQRAVEEARTYCTICRGTVYQYLNWPEESAGAWHDVGARSQALDMPQLAALASGTEAMALAVRLGRPADALAVLAPHRDPPPIPPIRRYLRLIEALITALGDPAPGRDLLTEALHIPWRHRDLRPLVHETAQRPGRLQRAVALRTFATVIRSAEATVTYLWPGGDAPRTATTPHYPASMDFPGRRLTLRGLELLNDGHTAEAIPVLLDGAAQATRDGHLTWVAQAHWALVDAYAGQHNPAAEYRHLLAALQARDEIHDRVLDPDDRIEVTGQTTIMYETGVLHLYLHRDLKDGGPDWPAQPLTAALMLLERSRSRVFLQLLGEALPLPPDPALRSLVQAEREAYQAYADAAPDATRDGRTTLEQTWARIAQTGPEGTEYVALRRGTPATFDEIRTILRGTR